jgi:hypothetical protein
MYMDIHVCVSVAVLKPLMLDIRMEYKTKEVTVSMDCYFAVRSVCHSVHVSSVCLFSKTPA